VMVERTMRVAMRMKHGDLAVIKEKS